MSNKHIKYGIGIIVLGAILYLGIQGANNAGKYLNTWDLQKDSKRLYKTLSEQFTLTKLSDTTFVMNRNSVDYDAVRYISEAPQGFNNTIVKAMQTIFIKNYKDIRVESPWTKQGPVISTVLYLVDNNMVIYVMIIYYQEDSDRFVTEYIDVRKSDIRY